ncbi:winged helix-turn-helix domain-containing protein [Burkholderia semiarida]|uniref:winged helix-turn-helix domain-containing protein n=1 Tax=Burkholderia semiarida TaxID=2843303 RepID=UPI0023DDA10B|nr:winged helix-turn-helix domain-containing protein [Burkholderia semiarida]MDF3091437.1 winged helix-turn-helix domain-containing protein [Burkholderia semiarida]
MKQIERQGSAQRSICELLERHGAMTINELAAARGVDPRPIARQLDALLEAGFVSASGSPKRYTRSEKPIPAVVPLKPKSARIAESRRRDAARVSMPFRIPAPTELDRVMLSWVGVEA